MTQLEALRGEVGDHEGCGRGMMQVDLRLEMSVHTVQQQGQFRAGVHVECFLAGFMAGDHGAARAC